MVQIGTEMFLYVHLFRGTHRRIYRSLTSLHLSQTPTYILPQTLRDDDSDPFTYPHGQP